MLAAWFRAHPYSASGGSTLDTQTVTVGTIGSAPSQDRARGYALSAFGSISDGTSNVYSGSPITELYWDENFGDARYILTITGAANSGWSTMTIGSTTLYRTAASYSSGSWYWTTTHTAGTQAFGGAGGIKTVTFA